MKTVIMGKQVEAEFFGDGVYCYIDDTHIVICANDIYNPTDKVYLEPDIFDRLTEWVKKHRIKKKE